MANGFSTGVSAKPIDLTSGARSFMRSAVEARINEIGANQERISKDNEMLLKALSIKALPELAREQRDRYTTEIEGYRQKLIDKWKTSGKNLTSRDQMEIQDGFLDLQSRMAAETNELKQYEQAQKLMSDPNFQYAYDPVKYEKVMKEAYSNLMAGKGIGDINAKLFGAQLAPSAGNYVAKRYGDDIKALDQYELGDIKGNIFTETQYQGLALENNPNLTPLQKQGIAKAQRLRAEMGTDPFFQRNYQKGGVPDENMINQKITDLISPVIQKSSTFRTGTGGGIGSKYEPYVNTTPFEDKVGKKDVVVNSSISLTDTPAFASGKRKVAPEAIEYHNTAVSEDAYRKAALKYYEKEGLNLTTAKQLIDEQVAKNLIIDKKFLPYFDSGDFTKEAYVKVQYPEKAEVDFSDLTTLLNTGTKTVVDYIPYSNQSVKNALGGKLGSKREKVFSAAESLRGQTVTKEETKPPKTSGWSPRIK